MRIAAIYCYPLLRGAERPEMLKMLNLYIKCNIYQIKYIYLWRQ